MEDDQDISDVIPIIQKPNTDEDIQRFKDRANRYYNTDCNFCDQVKPVIYGMHHAPYGDVLVICADCVPIKLVLSGYESDFDYE